MFGGCSLGLVPTEYSSGVSGPQGSITEVGSAHLRGLVIESAWHHRAFYRNLGPSMRSTPRARARRWPRRPCRHDPQRPHSAAIHLPHRSHGRRPRHPLANGRHRTPVRHHHRPPLKAATARCTPRFGAVVAAGPPRRATGAPPAFPRPVFNGQSTDDAAPRSQPLVCRFVRSPVPPVRLLGSLPKVEQALLRLLAEDDPVPL
ncbi:transposase [Mycobacterium seoulense]|uniref:transposase n=1 Tax=Mycobacterium seoulense TaxID=386911 RepID=UPI0027E350EC|nr:transposase [Mycobacterium seoulense]